MEGNFVEIGSCNYKVVSFCWHVSYMQFGYLRFSKRCCWRISVWSSWSVLCSCGFWICSIFCSETTGF